ncbi:hypothetical protein [Mycobacterium kubicae]|uniref:hypothetical protein n=1 Tax=Mycobacterium kubicae TaxID=120959 RepID=UPI003BF8D58E
MKRTPVPAPTLERSTPLARARAADADLARVRVGAKPAGDPDPYRDRTSTGPLAEEDSDDHDRPED